MIEFFPKLWLRFATCTRIVTNFCYQHVRINFNEESYRIIGCCLEVYNNLGKGFLEIVYKDALGYEFKKLNILIKEKRNTFITYDTL